MRYIALLFAVLLMVATVAPAFAANICVQNSFVQFLRFDNVPTPLVKGKTINLKGELHPNGTDVNVPFEGALTLASDGVTTRIGIMSFSLESAFVVGVIWSMVGDKKFNATGTYDNAPFNSPPDGNDTWTRVSCAPPFPSPAIAPLSLVGGAPGSPE